MANLQIKIGENTNRLTLIELIPKTKGHQKGFFQCECGVIKPLRLSHVKSNGTKSCGCLNKEQATAMCNSGLSTTHGLSIKGSIESRIYNVHNSIKSRCYNSKTREYKWYGAKGVKMCDEWLKSPVAFNDWCIKNGYKSKMDIDRIDGNGDYSPENCRIVTHKVNMNNIKNNRIVTWQGVTKNCSEWAEHLGVDISAFYCRVNRGWELERIFNQPYKGKR